MKSMIAMTAALLVTAASASAATLDADGDGNVSFEEMLAVYPDTTEDSFATIDTDADGMINEAELAAAVEAGLVPANG